jgi:hypothetical protein
MLTYPLSLSRSSEGFSGATGFASVQLVDEVHLVRAALSAAYLQAVKDRIHQSARNVTSVFRCCAPVRQVLGHMVTVPHGLLDQSLCARLGYVDRWHDATVPVPPAACDLVRAGADLATAPAGRAGRLTQTRIDAPILR